MPDTPNHTPFIHAIPLHQPSITPSSQLPNNPHRRLRHFSQRRRHRLRCRCCRPGVLRVAVHVEPRAADDELQVMREIEDRGDEGEGEDEEEDRIYTHSVSTDVSGERPGGGHTKDELFNRGKDVDAVCDLELVDLELDPLAEGLEVGRHGGVGRGYGGGRGGVWLCWVEKRTVMVAAIAPAGLDVRGCILSLNWLEPDAWRMYG